MAGDEGVRTRELIRSSSTVSMCRTDTSPTSGARSSTSVRVPGRVVAAANAVAVHPVGRVTVNGSRFPRLDPAREAEAQTDRPASHRRVHRHLPSLRPHGGERSPISGASVARRRRCRINTGREKRPGCWDFWRTRFSRSRGANGRGSPPSDPVRWGWIARSSTRPAHRPRSASLGPQVAAPATRAARADCHKRGTPLGNVAGNKSVLPVFMECRLAGVIPRCPRSSRSDDIQALYE